MNFTKQFILRNLLKLKDLRGEVNEEALSNLLDYFRDELYLMREAEELSQNYEHGSIRREEAFTEWATERILSINQ